MRLGDDQVEFVLKVTDGDARKIVDAPRKTIRTMDAGLVQTIKTGLAEFLETEETNHEG